MQSLFKFEKGYGLHEIAGIQNKLILMRMVEKKMEMTSMDGLLQLEPGEEFQEIHLVLVLCHRLS